MLTIVDDSTEEGRSQLYADLTQRIKDLESYSGEDLAKQMTVLKKTLKENPSACALMMPEDIGMLVSALRKITGKAAVAAAAKPARGKAKPKVLSKEEMEAAWDEI